MTFWDEASVTQSSEILLSRHVPPPSIRLGQFSIFSIRIAIRVGIRCRAIVARWYWHEYGENANIFQSILGIPTAIILSRATYFALPPPESWIGPPTHIGLIRSGDGQMCVQSSVAQSTCPSEGRVIRIDHFCLASRWQQYILSHFFSQIFFVAVCIAQVVGKRYMRWNNRTRDDVLHTFRWVVHGIWQYYHLICKYFGTYCCSPCHTIILLFHVPIGSQYSECIVRTHALASK